MKIEKAEGERARGRKGACSLSVCMFAWNGSRVGLGGSLVGPQRKEMEAQVRRYSEVHGPSVVVSWIIGESHFKHEDKS